MKYQRGNQKQQITQQEQTEGVIRPVVSDLAPSWVIRYIYDWNLQLLKK
jgi:hypothetical protein